MSIPDGDALGPSIERAVAAGIPVISMNSGSDVAAELGALLHVGQSEYDAGLAAGQELASMGGTNAICVNQEVGNVSLDLRCAGFEEGFGGTVTVLPTTNDPTEIQNRASPPLLPRTKPSTRSWRWVPVPPANRRLPPRMRPAVKSWSRPSICGRASWSSSLQATPPSRSTSSSPAGLSAGRLPCDARELRPDPGWQRAVWTEPHTAEKAEQVIELSAQGIRSAATLD